jgi:glycosyltransferase involved in cell wall biosynthesis
MLWPSSRNYHVLIFPMSNSTRPPVVSFVIPLYFTGAGVEPLLDAFRDLPLDGGYELVLINDGSTDDTAQRVTAGLAAYPVPVTFIDLARNFGEHAAVLEGLRHSRGEFVINLDDDLQNPVSEALKVLAKLRESEAEVVYTWFKIKRHHWFRNLGSWLTNRAATFLLGKPRDLYLSSFRGLRQSLVQRIILYRGPYPYIDGLILGATNRIERLEVEHSKRAAGESGYTLRKLLRLWMNMFFNFSVMPLRVASILGGLLCGIGLIAMLLVVVNHFTSDEPAGWGSLMAAVCLFSGSQLLILGLLGEYVGRSYLTLSAKPQSLVRSLIRQEGSDHISTEPASTSTDQTS